MEMLQETALNTSSLVLHRLYAPKPALRKEFSQYRSLKWLSISSIRTDPSGPDGIITQDLHRECLYIPRIPPAQVDPDNEGLFHAHGYAFFVRQGFLYFLQHCTAGSMSIDPALSRLRRLFRGIPARSKWHIIFLPDRALRQGEEGVWNVRAGKRDKWETVAKVVVCNAYCPWQQQKSPDRHRR